MITFGMPRRHKPIGRRGAMTGDQNELSRAHKRLDEGRLTSAAINFRESLAPLDRTATPKQMAQSLAGLGRIAYARGDAARARLYAEEALRHLSVSREAKELLADLTSPDQPPNPHDSWRREADLAKQRATSSSP
jgi:hypothetical protein